MTPEERDILVDTITERVEENLANKNKGIKSPKTGIVRGSLVGPFLPKAEKAETIGEALKDLKDEILGTVEGMIEGMRSSLEGNAITEEIVYQAVENYITNTYKRYFVDKKKGTQIRRAYCKTNAPAATYITCYLDVDTTGPQITVYCSTNGINLNSVLPYLTDGRLIFVAKIGDRWHCLSLFRKAKICT